MRFLIAALFLFVGTACATGYVIENGPQKLVTADDEWIGQETVEIEIIFSTTKYILDWCPREETGFHVGKRADTQILTFYCGPGTVGNTYVKTEDVGI